MVTWGAPRVGDRDFQTACFQLPNLRVAAFANVLDPVPKSPPEEITPAMEAITYRLPGSGRWGSWPELKCEMRPLQR